MRLACDIVPRKAIIALGPLGKSGCDSMSAGSAAKLTRRTTSQHASLEVPAIVQVRLHLASLSLWPRQLLAEILRLRMAATAAACTKA